MPREIATQFTPWVILTENPYIVITERRRDLQTCWGIDDRHGLPVCVFEILGIGGKYVPASRELGLWTDQSHYSHNRNAPDYATNTRPQCKACHLLYTQGIGHFSSVKKINSHSVYLPEAMDFRNWERFRHLDVSLRRPSDVLDALTEQLYKYGVRWPSGETVSVPENWYGPGKREHVVDIAKRLYAPNKLDAAIWSAEV